MKDSIIVISRELRSQIAASPQNAEQITGSVQALAKSAGWKILLSCIGEFREKLIDQMKVMRGDDLFDLQAKLIAIDLIKTLPTDILEEVHLVMGINEGGGKDEYGFVDNRERVKP